HTDHCPHSGRMGPVPISLLRLLSDAGLCLSARYTFFLLCDRTHSTDHIGVLTAIGTLTGAHRLFSHRAFKTHWTFRLSILVCQTIAGQGSAIRWAREHRTHHQYNGTDADCANINRGFFYAH